MEDETGFGTTNTQYANFADEEAVKAAYEKELADKAAAAEKEQMEADAEEIENQEHDEPVVIEDLDDLIDNLTEEEIKKVEEKEEDPPKQEKVELGDPIIQDDLWILEKADFKMEASQKLRLQQKKINQIQDKNEYLYSVC